MNLNVTRTTRAPVERFDPQRPQGHNPTLYHPSFATLLVMVGAGATIVGMLIFGVMTLANGGKFPDAKALMHPYEKYVKGEKAGEKQDAQGSSQTDEEQLKEVLTRYASTWNAGWENESRPASVFGATTAIAVDTTKAKGTDIVSRYEPTTQIAAAHLDNYALLSDTKAQGEATFVVARRQPLAVWDESAKTRPTANKIVVIEQAVRYALTLEKQGQGEGEEQGWRITAQTWLDKSPARIKEQEDQGVEAFPVPDGETSFTEKRPTRESLQLRYDAIAAAWSRGSFPRSEVFSSYTLHHTADGIPLPGKGRALYEITQRLQKLHAGAQNLQFTATVEGVSQLDESRTIAVVNYRMNLTTNSGNLYTATWKDKDTWATAQGTNNWYLLETERPQPSPLRDYFGL